MRQSLELETEVSGDIDGSKIIDLTARADKSNRKGQRDPKTVYALVLHQMACCANRKDPLNSYLKIGSHFAILRDGRILQLHPVSALVWASNGFNNRSVAVEFAGNFPNTRGTWWKGDQYGKDRVTPAQVEAGRYLIRWLVKSMRLTHVLAHRQSSGTRENDPGPDIWYHVGQWAVDNLKLRDGGPGFKIGDGAAIPDAWRRWNKPLSVVGPAANAIKSGLTQEIAHDEYESDAEADELDANEFELISQVYEQADESEAEGEQEWEQERMRFSRPAPGRFGSRATKPQSRAARPAPARGKPQRGSRVRFPRRRGFPQALIECNCPNYCPEHIEPSSAATPPAPDTTAPDADAATSDDTLPAAELFEFEAFEWEEEINRSSRDYILWVQQSLNRIAGAGLDEDGISGALTRAAIQAFQRSKGLTADGIVGPNTEAALIKAGATAPAEGGAPATSVPVDTPLPASGMGFYSYTSADNRYGTAATISALQAIAAEWNRLHSSGPRIGIGHISRQGGGEFPKHSTHREGLNVDIRPVRSDRGESPVSYTNSGYSRTLTQELVNTIYANRVLGVSSILFNDSGVQRVTPYSGHDDHLHVTFLRPSGTVSPGVIPPMPTPAAGGSLRDRVVQIALQERQRWSNGALEEWDDAARPILIDYWTTGVGMKPTDAARFVEELYAWSAAFISWVLRKAGAGSNFAYNSYHSTYIAAAYKNQQQRSANPFKAYSRTQVAPRLGDLICTTYTSNGVRPPADVSLVRANTPGYHCDIVVQSTGGQLTVVGGNVGDTVGTKSVKIDSRGYITDSAYFGVLQVG
jgi:peptidoglycan hydrolase-like protein with peptidoglycan-binding domain